MDLFDEGKEPETGFSADVAKQLVNMHRKHFTPLDKVMYPYNHIRVAAEYGHDHIIKPANGLTPQKANELKKHGFNVEFVFERNHWVISWE